MGAVMGADSKIPPNHRQAERVLIAKVLSGEWSIDAAGRIWIRRLYTGRVLAEPVRAERVLTAGYLMVRATISGKRVVGGAHRLVWQALNGDIPDGMVINHKNGKKGDNRPENLEVETYSGNTLHARRVLGVVPQKGEKNNAAKLTASDVAEIRLARARGEKPTVIAARFGIRYQHVYRLCNGERWGHLAAPTERKAANGR